MANAMRASTVWLCTKSRNSWVHPKNQRFQRYSADKSSEKRVPVRLFVKARPWEEFTYSLLAVHVPSANCLRAVT
jgi:hypothetical protein